MSNKIAKIKKRLSKQKVSLEDIVWAIAEYPPVFSTPKYLVFAKKALESKFRIGMYFAEITRSKYIYVRWHEFTYKIRFSDHAPNRIKEESGDCDFFVGVTNFNVTTSEDAWKNMIFFFRSKGWSE